MLLIIIMLGVGVPLTVVAWIRGWNWRALLPLPIGIAVELVVEYIIVLVMVGSIDYSNYYNFGSDYLSSFTGMAMALLIIPIVIDLLIIGILVFMVVKGRNKAAPNIFSAPVISSAPPVYNAPAAAPSTPVYNTPPAAPVKPVYNPPVISPAAPVYNTPAAQVHSVPAVAPAAPVYSAPAVKPQPAAVIEPPTVLAPLAKLILPDKSEIAIGRTDKAIGRHDLEKIVSPEDLKFISRQHVIIRTNCSQYYVEDRNSSNNTKVNGVNITGKGKQELRDGDNIMLADVVTLQFKTDSAF